MSLLHLGVLALLMQTPVGVASAPIGQGRDQAAQQQRQPVTGTASLSGIVMTENGQPVKNARVALSGNQIPRTFITDATGTFSFERLPEGRYGISVTKPRYLSGSYGQKRPDRQGTTLQLATGEHLRGLTITLFGAGVISGNVYGDDGEPVQNANVRVYRYMMQNGVRRPAQAGSAQTDDRGAYRIYGLSPGDYIVSAVSSQGAENGFQINAATQAALEKAAVAAEAAGQAFSFRVNNGSLTLTTGETIEMPAPMSFAPTYYPGTPMSAGAVAVPVRSGEERSGIDVPLVKAQSATVSGSVIAAVTPAPTNISVMLQSNDEFGVNMPSVSTTVTPDGRFTLRNVPPGQYLAIARAQTTVRREVPVGAAAQPGQQLLEVRAGNAGQMIQTVVSQSFTGRAAVSVDGQPVSGVVIALDAGRSLTGQVQFVGAAQPDPSKVRLVATLQPVQMGPGPNSVPPPADIGTDGAFKISGIAPGKYMLRVSSANGLSVLSSVVAGRDSLDFPFEVDTEDITGAVVTMGPPKPVAGLSGVLTDQEGKPVSDYTILVFSADQRFWTSNSRRIFNTRPGTDGKYQVGGMQAGDYLIAALSDLEPGLQYDPEFLKSLIVASTRVTIGEGTKLTQDLRITIR